MTHDIMGCTAYRDDNGVFSDYFAQCRACSKSTIWTVTQKNGKHSPGQLIAGQGLLNESVIVHDAVRPRGAMQNCPEHTPADLKLIFDEGAECISIGAWNAASAMFRKIVDQISKEKMAAAVTQPSDNRTRFNLKPRLNWLFAHDLLPSEVEPLANAIREDGNDGVHNAPLGRDDALDVQDFTIELLETLYTRPGRLQEAEARRAARRASP